MQKIKNILFEMDIEGRGVINHDSNAQKHYHKEFKTPLSFDGNFDNVNFAKKNFYYTGETTTKNYSDNTVVKKNVEYKLKMSTDCVKAYMFDDEIIARTSKVQYDEQTLYMFLASPYTILTGHLLTNKPETLKRASALKMVDAIQTNDAISSIEVFSGRGERDSTSLFYKETVGDITYNTYGNFDLEQLQFISCDQIYDRYSFNPDRYEMFKQFASLNFNDFDSDFGKYIKKTNTIRISERGVKLSDNVIVQIVKYGLKRLLDFDAWKRDAFAKTKSLRIKFIENGLTDKYGNQGWIEIKSYEDIEKLDFSVFEFYEKVVDVEKDEQLRSELEKISAENTKKPTEKKTRTKKQETDE